MSQTPPKTSALAIWSLALGILGLLCCSLFTALPGVICGHKALGRIKKSGGTVTGEGLAIAGLITGYIGIALSVIVLPFMFVNTAINFNQARERAQANLCILNLNAIDQAKQQWALDKQKQGTSTPSADDLLPYLKNHLLPVCPSGGTYSINPANVPPTCSITNHVIKP